MIRVVSSRNHGVPLPPWKLLTETSLPAALVTGWSVSKKYWPS